MNELIAQSHGVTPEKAVVVLLSILDGVTGYMLSPDAWYLAYGRAEDLCKELGVTPEEFEKVKEQFQRFRQARKSRSPLACLHAAG